MVDGIGFDELLAFLRDSPFFRDFQPQDLVPLLDTVQVREVADADVVFAQGDAADAFYVVFRGQVSIDRTWQDGGSRRLSLLGPHACFGEQAILESAPRMASATVVGDGVLLRFPRSKFERLLESGNATAVKLVVQLARTTSARLRANVEAFERLRSTVVAALDDGT